MAVEKMTKVEKWWKPNSTCERNLLIAVILFVILSLCLMIALIVVSKSEDEICTSQVCIEAAHEFLTNMDQTANPCEDFYQYACGGYPNTTNILDDSSTNKFAAKMMENKELMRRLISQPSKPYEPRYYKLVKDLHTSCLNESKIEELGFSPLFAILNKVGGWPVVEGSDWKENNFDWRQSLVEFRSMGTNFNLFFNVAVRVNLMNSDRYILSISEPGTSLPIDYYKKRKYRNGYLKLMTDVAVLLGAEKSRAEREMKVVLEFETKISEFLTPKEERRNLTKFQNEYKVYELQSFMPQISWVEFLNSMKFATDITSYDDIIVTVPKNLKQISNLLSNTNKRIISNYMLWRTILGHCELVHKSLHSLCSKFYEEYFGNIPFTTRKHYCISKVISTMRTATGAMFVKNFFTPESKKSASELVSNIKDELTHSLSNNKWMDPETLKKAMDKLRAMKEFVAYPDELLNDSKVNNFYKMLRTSETQFCKNILDMSRVMTDYYFSLLNKRVDEDGWLAFAGSTTVNAMNMFTFNRIQIFAGILGGTFYNTDWPKYLNYGGIGTIIGHEFIHGFDDIGKQFDTNGNLRNWWANETATKFRDKADKVVQQYSHFEVPEVKLTLNGINVQGEAISDIGGFNLAYKAYEKWADKNQKEYGLPGLSLNSRQLFWMKAANVWCWNGPEESLINQIINGFHPPNRYRIIGPVINSKYFSKDFNCPVGSPMNPSEKISLW